MATVIGTDIQEAIHFLEGNETVGIPTETVYGLAANALSEIAVAKIFAVKERPFFDPLIVHLKDALEISKYAVDVPNIAFKLAEEFWPGPLTMVLKKQINIPDIVTSGGDTVALRVPNSPLTLKLLKQLNFPLAAPSANPFTYVSPTTAEHVFDQLNSKIPYILDGGSCEVGIESTIIRVTEDKIEILRPGGVSEDDLRNFLPNVKLEGYQPNSSKVVAVPGQFEQHYSPFCRLIPIEEFENVDVEIDAVIYWKKADYNPLNSFARKREIYLTENGNYLEGSKNLFSILRQLDKEQLKNIVFHWAPNDHLGVAINDRLKRASAKRNLVV